MLKLQESLQRFGLSETEAKIYLALIKLKGASAVRLAKETQVHRRTIYDNLNILIRKGLASSKKKEGVQIFQARNPKSLRVFIDEKKEILESILPTLSKVYEERGEGIEIEVLAGLESAKGLVEEALQTKETAYWVGGGFFFFKALHFSKGFIQNKMKKMKIKTVQPNVEGIEELTRIMKKEDIRVLPKSFVSRCGYFVYGDTIALGLISENEAMVVRIKNKETAKGFKNYFDAMWQIGKPLK